MTCHDEAMAGQVLLYRELGEEERAAVDSHVTECNDCAEALWALDRFEHKLARAGEKRRMALIHPTEEQIIQLAIDPNLLQPEQRARIQHHFERENCASCERIYWSVLESEQECAKQLKEEPKANFWLRVFPIWKKPAFALALALVILQAVEIRQIAGLKQQVRSQLAENSVRLSQKNSAISTPQAVQPMQQAGPGGAGTLQQNPQQEKTIAELRQKLQPYLKPRADAAYVLLLSAGRGGDTIPTAELQDSKLFLVLQANLSKELGQYKTYKLVLQDSSRNIVKSDRVAQQDGTLNYLVRKELLKPGLYTLEIYGVDGNQAHDLVQFPFRLAATR